MLRVQNCCWQEPIILLLERGSLKMSYIARAQLNCCRYTWYSPIKPQSVYKTAEVQVYWDVPVYGEYQELRPNGVHARIVNNREKQLVALEMSCPWMSNRDKKASEKTMKYAPLRWELKQRYPGYEMNQSNIILDVLVGWSKDLDATLKVCSRGCRRNCRRRVSQEH